MQSALKIKSPLHCISRAALGGGEDMPPSPIINHLVRTVTGRVSWRIA
jgi:hypothetical protein